MSIFDWIHVHNVLKLMLVFVDLFAVFVHFHDWSIHHKRTVVAEGLKSLLVVAISVLRVKIFIESGDFILIRVIVKRVHLVGLICLHLQGLALVSIKIV